MFINLMKENGFTLKKKKKKKQKPGVDYILWKILLLQTTQMTKRFFKIHLFKPNLYCIA